MHDPACTRRRSARRLIVVVLSLGVALLASGCTSWVWGRNSSGQLGLGTTTQQASPQLLGSLPQGEWRTVGGGVDHTCGVRLDGSLWCWGGNTFGQLGDGTTAPQDEPTRIGTASDWASVAGGSQHTCGIRATGATGTLWCWGDNTFGQLGDGTNTDRTTPRQVGTATDWLGVSLGTTHTCGIREVQQVGTGGRLYCWGDNWAGQLGDGTTTNRNTPTLTTENHTTWVQVSLGDVHSCGLSGTYLYCWGLNAQGQLGLGSSTPVFMNPTFVDFDFDELSVGGYHTCAVTRQTVRTTGGQLWCAGLNSSGQIGDGTTTQRNALTRIGALTDWAHLLLGGQHSCATRDNGTLSCWGDNASGQLGDGSFVQRETPTPLVAVIQPWNDGSGGFSHTCVTLTDDSLWCWGENGQGQLGNGTTVDQPSPDPIEPEILTMSAGAEHTCRIRIDRSLWCWGQGISGRIGDGSSSGTKTEPVQVGTARTWRSVSAGGNHTCATRIDNTLWCWGANNFGQIGAGNFPGNQLTPIQVGSTLSWRAVSTGDLHTCAIRTDGALFCWGANGNGQLGVGGSFITRTNPTQVGTATNWRAVDAGERHTCALRDDSSLWCWGIDASGQRGDGPGGSGSVNDPVQIGLGSTWRQLGVGANHSCARRSDRTLWCWGENGNFQLGDNTTTDRDAPVQIGTDTNWELVSGGGLHTCAIRTDRSAWCWGENSDGQLGDGTTADRATPTAAADAQGWTMLDAGGNHTVAVTFTP